MLIQRSLSDIVAAALVPNELSSRLSDRGQISIAPCQHGQSYETARTHNRA